MSFHAIRNLLDVPVDLPRPSLRRSRSARARQIIRWFGLDAPAAPPICTWPDLSQLLPAPGQILLITGPSGAGKSLLLRTLLRGQPCCIDLHDLPCPARPIVDCFGRHTPLPVVLSLLARVGLSEAWTYLRKASELSDGQRWRLRLALGMHQASSACRRSIRNGPILACDEFAALLDRVTAAVVARALRRALDASAAQGRPLRAIVATSHDDLLAPLDPDLHVRCDFGRLLAQQIKHFATKSSASTVATEQSIPAPQR